MHQKSQVSMEFTLTFALVLTISLVFLKVLDTKISDLQSSHDFISMQNLANSVKNEVFLASQARNSYIRRFEMPYKLNGKAYTIRLKKDELAINITEEKNKEIHAILPKEIKGGFIEGNEPGFLDYCVTKNNDNILISRNMAALEYSAYDSGNDGFSTNDYIDPILLQEVPSINNNRRFRVYLNINCVFNLQSINFDLGYDSSKLKYVEALKPRDHFGIGINPDILSDWIGKAYFYDSQDCGTGCRHISIVKVGVGPLGSGIAAEFEFEAAGEGVSNIGINNLELIDSSITPTIEGYIPPFAAGMSVRVT